MLKIQAEISKSSLSKIIAMAFILVVGSEILSIGASAAIEALLGYDENSSRWLGMLASWTPITAVAYVVMRWSSDAVSLLKITKLRFPWIAFGIVAGVFLLMLLDAINNFHENAQAEMLKTNISAFRHDVSVLTIIPFLAFLMSFHILIPIFEEIVYRGMIFRHISVRFGYIPAYLITSGAFAFVHSRFVLTFIFSVVSCFLTQKSRSLIPSIVMHVTYNALVTVCAFTL
jgi:membrane protease YdiL (CAAX protease family)